MKSSTKRGPEQFWVEIFAYRLGCEMDVSVPPTFAAYDEKTQQCGALKLLNMSKVNVLSRIGVLHPVFDNGSSMGYEILPDKFKTRDLQRYISAGPPTFFDWINEKSIIGAWVEKRNGAPGRPTAYIYVEVASKKIP